jgi:hypothetical protein
MRGRSRWASMAPGLIAWSKGSKIEVNS